MGLYEIDEDFFDEIEERHPRNIRKKVLAAKINSNKDNENVCEDSRLKNVIGHDAQKKELLNVITWFNNSKELKKKGISIPRGCVLFGEAGNGKSLLIRELIKIVDAPVFIYKGDDDNVVNGIEKLFKEAREAGHAIIVIDELDLLINKERRVVRALQENLDGVESSDDILVLAATNEINDIPGPLLRNGRLEKLIHIPYLNAEQSVKLLRLHLNEFNVQIPSDFDDEEVGLSLHHISCAGIKAIVNDLVLRNGFENITTEMIDQSIYNIAERVKHTTEASTIDVAIHESSHALMAMNYKDHFFVNKLNLDGGSGYFTTKEVVENYWPYSKCLADIHICMAGVIGQRLLCKEPSKGAESDLERSRKMAYCLLNKSGYSSCWETLPDVSETTRTETWIKRRKMEKKIERLLKKCEKETVRYLSNHKKEIMALANLLFEKKHLKSTEIITAIETVK